MGGTHLDPSHRILSLLQFTQAFPTLVPCPLPFLTALTHSTFASRQNLQGRISSHFLLVVRQASQRSFTSLGPRVTWMHCSPRVVQREQGRWSSHCNHGQVSRESGTSLAALLSYYPADKPDKPTWPSRSNPVSFLSPPLYSSSHPRDQLD